MEHSDSVLRTTVMLLRPFWPVAAFATAMGGLSGIATAWLLATINNALSSGGNEGGAVVWAFIGIVALMLVSGIASDFGNSWVGQQILANLRSRLVDKVLAAPIDRIERFRSHRIIASLTDDVNTISVFTFNFSSIAISLAVTIGCLAYLIILSPGLTVIVVCLIAGGLYVNRIFRARGGKGFESARAGHDDLQKHYKSLVDGAKELRINRARRRRFRQDHIGETIIRIRDVKVVAMRYIMTANALDSVLFFIVVGLIVGFRDVLGLERATVSGFTLVLLYVKGPLDQVVGSYGAFVNAQISLRRVGALFREFSQSEQNLLDEVRNERADDLPPGFERLDLCGVSYSFPTVDNLPAFHLGPIDLSVSHGEILFVVGENGCGKSTLIKLLLGLYKPQQGEVLLNGQLVTDSSRDHYRQFFSVVFFDYFLFDDVTMAPNVSREAAKGYLDRLDIGHKVTISEAGFSTTDLSAGQRKRLALMHVYLEDRPVVVLDEWAAEQDPTYRRIFYTELLPDLKRQGKTLIVISHDDRYFDVADRVIRLEGGRIVDFEERMEFAATSSSERRQPSG